MLTRRRKALMLLETPPVKEEVKKMTLLSLPDVPLVLILSYLSPKDLIATGQADPRLAALTREHSKLWRGRVCTDRYYFKSVPELMGLVRVVPPVHKVKFEVKRSPMILAHFEKFDRQSAAYATTTLALEGPDMECCVAVIQEIKSALEYVEVTGLDRGLEVLLESLQVSPPPFVKCLEIRLESYFSKCLHWWPMGKVVPKLRSLVLLSSGEYFDGVKQCGPDPSLLDALRSLMRAHSNRLIYVRLGSPQMLPLLNACSAALPTLSLTVAADQGAGLKHLRSLKDIRIHMNQDKFHVDTFLKSSTAPLQRLDLRNCSDRLVRSLGTLSLGSLQHLALTCGYSGWTVGALQVALAGMPNLQSLHVLGVRKPRPFELLTRVSSAAIPKLTLLLFTDACGRTTDNSPSVDFWNDFDSNDSMDSDSDSSPPPPPPPRGYLGATACEDLVRRAPSKELHIAVCFTWSHKGILFFEHSKSVEGCALCDQASTAVTYRCGKEAKLDELIQVQ
ncbi:F-box only protein 3 [Frankliniella fusca]|uniref:F-box only protein 3 n=1 Tax=Frankliniella fusca TaxID=407009 RepID=A0AAE1LBS4_9NEOP|nr:F-box only protein 3 [Frankliniella fusca]